MVSYLYTAEVRPEFGRLEELLVLANRLPSLDWLDSPLLGRYSVEPLVARVSSLLAATLSPATALRLGILGEAHEAEPLLGASARSVSCAEGHIWLYCASALSPPPGTSQATSPPSGKRAAPGWRQPARAPS
jgi:hypothetical protein